MILLEDTRQQAGKHDLKHDWFEKHGIEIRRTKLWIGDYTLPANQSICIDSKMAISELIQDVQTDHIRFRAELVRAKEAGIKLYIVVENEGRYVDYRKTVWNATVRCIDDLNNWHNPRLYIKKNGKLVYPKAMPGTQLAKICHTMEERYGCKFLFCKPDESAKLIIDLLQGKEGG